MNAPTLKGRPQRYNGGTMRRYHFSTGAVLVIFSEPVKTCRVIPAGCPMVAVPIERAAALKALSDARHAAKAEACA